MKLLTTRISSAINEAMGYTYDIGVMFDVTLTDTQFVEYLKLLHYVEDSATEHIDRFMEVGYNGNQLGVLTRALVHKVNTDILEDITLSENQMSDILLQYLAR